MDTPIAPDVLTAADVALWLRLPTRAVERMARRGQIPSRELPTGDIVLSAAEVAEWLRHLPSSGRDAAHA